MRVQRNPAHGNRHRCACPAAKSFLLCRAWRRGCKILSLILEIHYDNYTEKFGKKWAWGLKETISVLGKNFEQALWFAAQVPEAPDDRQAFHAQTEGKTKIFFAIDIDVL